MKSPFFLYTFSISKNLGEQYLLILLNRLNFISSTYFSIWLTMLFWYLMRLLDSSSLILTWRSTDTIYSLKSLYLFNLCPLCFSLQFSFLQMNRLPTSQGHYLYILYRNKPKRPLGCARCICRCSFWESSKENPSQRDLIQINFIIFHNLNGKSMLRRTSYDGELYRRYR